MFELFLVIAQIQKPFTISAFLWAHLRGHDPSGPQTQVKLGLSQTLFLYFVNRFHLSSRVMSLLNKPTTVTCAHLSWPPSSQFQTQRSQVHCGYRIVAQQTLYPLRKWIPAGQYPTDTLPKAQWSHSDGSRWHPKKGLWLKLTSSHCWLCWQAGPRSRVLPTVKELLLFSLTPGELLRPPVSKAREIVTSEYRPWAQLLWVCLSPTMLVQQLTQYEISKEMMRCVPFPD